MWYLAPFAVFFLDWAKAGIKASAWWGRLVFNNRRLLEPIGNIHPQKLKQIPKA